MTIFKAVVEEGTMSGAARKLGVANSVISKNLNELEAWLGQTLIYRSTRSLNLSSEGQIYYEKIKHIVVAVESLKNPGSVNNIELTGTLKLTAPVIIGERLCENVLPKFHQEFPGIRLNFVLADNFNDLVKDGIDVAIRVTKLPDSNFIAKKVGEQRLRLVSSPTYMEKFGTPIDYQSLNRYPCIVDNSVTKGKRWGFVNDEGTVSTIQIDGPIEVNNAECVAQLCRAGVGIAQLPEIFVNDYIHRGELTELLPHRAIELDISILYHKGSTKSSLIKSVIDFFQTNIDEHCFL